MKTFFKELLQVKTIVILVMIFALICGWFVGEISSQEFVPMVTMILTFYFTDRIIKKEVTQKNNPLGRLPFFICML